MNGTTVPQLSSFMGRYFTIFYSSIPVGFPLEWSRIAKGMVLSIRVTRFVSKWSRPFLTL
jgi:hypothetical protein